MMMRNSLTRECLKFLKGLRPIYDCRRTTAKDCCPERKGLVLGAWECCDGPYKLTEAARQFDSSVAGCLTERFKEKMKGGQVELTHDLGGYYAVALTCIGPEGLGYVETERRNDCREEIRKATARGVNMLTSQECVSLCVDSMGSADAAAEGAKVTTWIYQVYKSPPKVMVPEMNLYSHDPSREKEYWDTGTVMGDAQNTARYFTEVPSNIMTPKFFAEEAIRILCPCGVHVDVRPLTWMEENRMFSFLNMAKGSCQMPYFLEMNYCGGAENDRPVVLCGKGVTFDSGGLCLKDCVRVGHKHGPMLEERTSKSGGAVVVGTLKALARMKVPVNVVGLVPLFENMPSGNAVKPGDVLMALNGKTIVVEDTDNEGRVALADVLVYSDHFKPCLDVTVGSFSRGARSSLGSGATPVFSTSEVVWEELEKASGQTGDRVWRFPLFKRYIRRVSMCHQVDSCNTGKATPDASACLAAAFLSKFVPGCDFLHMDNAGTGLISMGYSAPYLRGGFVTGRPTRTLAQFIYNMACPLDCPPSCGSS